MRKPTLLATLTIAVLTACNQAPTPPPPSPTNILGLLEVRLEGIGNGTPTATAQFIRPLQRALIGPQAATVVPDTGIQFARSTVTFLDHETTSTRYTSAVFNVTNTTPRAFNNLTLYAIDVPGTTIGGTAIASMLDATGTAITDVNVARSLLPTHSVRQSGSTVEVSPNNADLQVFTPAEALAAQQQALALPTPITGNVLEYGFVARAANGRRAIGAGTGSQCIPDGWSTCKGTITLAFKMPKLNPRSSNPWAFSLYFVLADETNTRITQSPEESTSALGQRVSALGTPEVAILPGSQYFSDSAVNFCRPRTAGSAASPQAFLIAPVTYGILLGRDECFGTSGKLRTTAGRIDEEALAVAQQADGKLIVAGVGSTVDGNDFSLVRFNPNGTLDTTFGGGGKVMTNFNFGSDGAEGVVVQPDGKIVAAGYASTGSNADFALARYLPDGTLDETFGGDGKVTTPIGTGADTGREVILQADGRILVVGSAHNGGNTDFALTRYLPDGTLDETFDGDGKVTTAIKDANDEAFDGVLQPDGKIVVVGSTETASELDSVVARYNADGSLDSTFNATNSDGAGKLVTQTSGVDALHGVALQSDGKIIVAGYAAQPRSPFPGFALMRVTSGGEFDATFSEGGNRRSPFGISPSKALDVAVQEDGKIVVGGWAQPYIGSGPDFALVRYTSNGLVETRNFMDVKTSFDFAAGIDHGKAMVVQSDGKIVLVGTTASETTGNDFGVVRVHP